MSQVRTLANGHLLWDSEFRFILNKLRTLAITDPDILKALIKKCIYPEYNFSTIEILILKHAKLIFDSESTVEKGIYTFQQAKQVILSELKKLGIDNIPELREVLKNFCGAAGLDSIIERFRLNLKGFTWSQNPSGDLVSLIADEITKLENKKTMQLPKQSPVPFPTSNTILLKSYEYLKDHRYHLLLFSAVAGVTFYDYYHDNYLGKIKNTLKNRALSFWQADSKEDKESFKDAGLSFVGPF